MAGAGTGNGEGAVDMVSNMPVLMYLNSIYP